MNDSDRHISHEKLSDIAENRVTPGERGESMAHISTCSNCATRLEKLERVMELMRTDTAEDAPRDLIADAVNIFAQRTASREPSLLRRVVAALSFDSLNTAPAFGVRSGASASRQMLFAAGEIDIDLRLTPQGDNWIVAGQVLGQGCAGGEVKLEGETESTAAMNELCEFKLSAVPPGNYRLRIRLENVEVEVPELELKA